MSKNTVIIGANRGIGLELVKQYVAMGYRVNAVCRKPSSELTEIDCNIVDNIDICDDDDVLEISDRLLPGDIDVIIHVSGILHSDSFPNLSIDSMKHHFDTNTLGPLRTIMALSSRLVNGSKVGVLTSRVGSIADNTSSNNYAYRTSKCALNMLGKCLSIDLKPKGIALALLHPGYVRTGMTNNNGLIDADESALGLINIMQSLSLDDSGTFYHTNGEVLPW